MYDIHVYSIWTYEKQILHNYHCQFVAHNICVHTSHTLQPLGISCFKLFNIIFKAYRDVWTLTNKGKDVGKEVLT
jgi:hypothetical protein